jgi:phage FluMu gp28-like protein
MNQQPFFLPYQQAWINDHSPLKIIEKSRQIGITYADAFDTVIKASRRNHPQDVWISSRDEPTARLYLQHCRRWAEALNLGALDLGERIIDSKKELTAEVLKFKTGCCVYSLTSVPDALASRTGHIKLDEFALHKNQRDLYTVAKPCTQWGGQLSIISTHRGSASMFNELLRKIKLEANPMHFSHHRVTIHDAVNQGLVERINFVTGRRETRAEFLKRTEEECVDQEQWLQEYCCVPCDDATAFITWDMITANTHAGCLRPFEYLETCENPLYLGMDVARKGDLCVIDVGEKIGDVMWDRLRLEFRDRKFSEIKHELYRILRLPRFQRACIDATGMGIQLAEEAKDLFGWRVEPVNFSAHVKEELAFELRHCFEDRKLRIDCNPKLRADLRGIKKEVTVAGNIRFIGDADDSHCDRFWAMALRQHAAKSRKEFIGFIVD